MTLLNSLHLVLCLAIFWNAFVRIMRTDTTTQRGIRIAFEWMAISSLSLAIAPWAWQILPWYQPFKPHWALLLLLAGMVIGLFASVKNWRDAVPPQFQIRRWNERRGDRRQAPGCQGSQT